MNTKAIAEATIALLIIGIISMAAVGTFVYKYSERQKCQQKIELCRISIITLDAFKKIPGHSLAGKIPKIDCPICVPDNDGEIKTIIPKEAMRQIAEHLRWCWHKTTGEDNTLGKDLGAFWFPRAVAEKDLDVCIVCSEFVTSTTLNSAEFIKYLQKTKISSGAGKGKTYADYFGQGMLKTTEQQKMPPTETAPITTTNPEEMVVITVPTSHLTPSRTEPQSNLQTPQIAITKEEEQRFEKEKEQLTHPERFLPSLIDKDKKYVVIAQNLQGEENRLLIIQNEEVPKLSPCVYHYQKE